MAEKIDARRLAFHSLLKCYKDRKYSNIELDSVIKQNRLESRDRAFLTALVYGVIEKRITLDYIISRLSSRPADKILPTVMTALEMGLYQILYFDRVPDSAACNESVEIAKKIAGKAAGGFVNAVLRQAILKKESIKQIHKELDGIDSLSIEYSMPVWIIELFEQSYGKDKAVEIINNLNGTSYMTLRTNTLNISRQQLTQRLNSDGIKASECDITPNGINLISTASLEALKNYQGLYIVQDTASQLAVKALDAREGQLVIDCCACPGGKSIGAALDMNNVGEIISMDLHKNKLSLIERTAQSLGINIIKTMEHNGTSPYQEYLSKADRVICDVPCSGLGVIHKKPDIRHKNPQDIQKLPETQLKILTSASRYLKTGGRLVYSTCTLNKSENQDITDRFLKDNENYRRVSNTTLFPVLKDGVVQNDGFYIDIIERVK